MTEPIEAPVEFDAIKFIARRNAEEQAKAEGKPLPDAPKAETKTEDHGTPPKLPRSAVRQMNELRERAARAEERAKVLEELGAKPKGTEATVLPPPAASDPEPQRKEFGTDAEYNRALGRWDARQEAAKVIDAKSADNSQMAQYQAQLVAADQAFVEQKALIPDFDEVAAAALEEEQSGERPTFPVSEHPIFLALVAQSDVRAFVLHHLAKNGDRLKEFLELEKNPAALVSKFHRLEGRVEKEYDSIQNAKKKGAEEKKPTAAERDAAKALPSETAIVKSGASAPQRVTSTIVVNGRTVMNPEWSRQQNEKQGVRP